MEEKINPQDNKNIHSGIYSIENMGNKKIVIIVSVAVLVVMIALAGYFWWKNSGVAEDANEAENISDEATKGTLPSISNNPLDSKPNLNPVENTNPIREVKTNPFE